MTQLNYFFAGGGTGGHIYPAIAVAQQVRNNQPDAKITFFCSERRIDTKILEKTGFEYVALPAKSFSFRPDKLVSFCFSYRKSYVLARDKIAASEPAVVLGIGGFVSAPVVAAASKLKVPASLLNLDIVPGRANKVLARRVKEIYVQFEETKSCFVKNKTVEVTGCPLRAGFLNPDPAKARELLGLDEKKRTLLITGGSSGAASINEALCLVLAKLASFASDWQIVHLAGPSFETVRQEYKKASPGYFMPQVKVLDYFDDMPDLMAAADLAVGRAGAVSVAEYVAAGLPSICVPYPYHGDRHQYLNAEKLAKAGCALVVVEDRKDRNITARKLGVELEELIRDGERREDMARACRKIARPDAAAEIARRMSISHE